MISIATHHRRRRLLVGCRRVPRPHIRPRRLRPAQHHVHSRPPHRNLRRPRLRHHHRHRPGLSRFSAIARHCGLRPHSSPRRSSSAYSLASMFRSLRRNRRTLPSRQSRRPPFPFHRRRSPRHNLSLAYSLGYANIHRTRIAWRRGRSDPPGAPASLSR